MILVAVSAKKHGGKSTLADMLERYASDIWPKREPYTGKRRLTPVRRLPMAEALKEICVDVLGLPAELVYGTDEQKETLTDIRWGQMPHYDRLVREWDGLGNPPFLDKDARMTVRQVMQEVGTGWFRAINPNIWIDRWKRHVCRLSEEGFDGVVIADDVRFPNELQGCREMEAFCVRLTRGKEGDGHASETSLSDSHPLFHLVIDNRDCTPLEVLRLATLWMAVDELDQNVALMRAKRDGYGR